MQQMKYPLYTRMRKDLNKH